MIDVLYLAGTVGFFALMIGYVAFCERLGRASASDDAGTGSRQ